MAVALSSHMAVAGHGGDHDGTTVAAGTCPPPPRPVMALDFDSRYAEDSENRTEIDEAALEEMEDALTPVDDLIASLANDVAGLYRESGDKRAIANCIVGRLAIWARAGALARLDSETSRLTIGSRYAGLALVLMQAEEHSDNYGDMNLVRRWFKERMYEQMTFWEQAPDGARQGNLRAWAALAGSAVSHMTNDPIIRGWSAWSANYILCTASEDGSLPQEMIRGRLALHYQLHAIAPLVVSTLLLERQGVSIRRVCGNALDRAVQFALDDLDGGMMSEAITGAPQSLFEDGGVVDGFRLAWLEAYLQLNNSREIDALAEQYRPLGFSKLGGNQTLMWK